MWAMIEKLRVRDVGMMVKKGAGRGERKQESAAKALKIKCGTAGGGSLRLAGNPRRCSVSRMDERIADDARFADLAKVRQARAMSARERFFAGSDLFEEACLWAMAGISARHPHADETERRRKLLGLVQLMTRTTR